MNQRTLPEAKTLVEQLVETSKKAQKSDRPNDDLIPILTRVLERLSDDGNSPKAIGIVVKEALLELDPSIEAEDLPHAILTLRIRLSRFLKGLTRPEARHLIRTQVTAEGEIVANIDETMATHLTHNGPTHYASPYAELNHDQTTASPSTNKPKKRKPVLAILLQEIEAQLKTMGDGNEKQEEFEQDEIKTLSDLVEQVIEKSVVQYAEMPRPMQRMARWLKQILKNQRGGILVFGETAVQWGANDPSQQKEERTKFWAEFETKHHDALWTWAEREQRPLLFMLDHLTIPTRKEEHLQGIQILWAGDRTHPPKLPQWVTPDRTPAHLITDFGTTLTMLKHEAVASLLEFNLMQTTRPTFIDETEDDF